MLSNRSHDPILRYQYTSHFYCRSTIVYPGGYSQRRGTSNICKIFTYLHIINENPDTEFTLLTLEYGKLARTGTRLKEQKSSSANF